MAGFIATPASASETSLPSCQDGAPTNPEDETNTNDNPFCLVSGDQSKSGEDEIAEICALESSAGLCTFALNSANTIFASVNADEDSGKALNCYSHHSVNGKKPGPPNIDLTNPDSAYAKTDCSGWIDYALTEQAKDNRIASIAVDEINNYMAGLPENGAPGRSSIWPAASVYRDYFRNFTNSLRKNARKFSKSWHGITDLHGLRPGDILAWCKSERCNPDSDKKQKGDTGHVMIVVAVNKLGHSKELVEAKTGAIPDNANNLTFWLVGVVDSSAHAHGSSYMKGTQTFNINEKVLHITDNRALTNSECSTPGGLGAGVIIVAQWQDEDGKTHWARAFANSAKYSLLTHASANGNGFFAMAAGRIGSAPFVITAPTDETDDKKDTRELRGNLVVADGQLQLAQKLSLSKFTNNKITEISLNTTGNSDTPYQISVTGNGNTSDDVDVSLIDETGEAYKIEILSDKLKTFTHTFKSDGPNIVKVLIRSRAGFNDPN